MRLVELAASSAGAAPARRGELAEALQDLTNAVAAALDSLSNESSPPASDTGNGTR